MIFVHPRVCQRHPELTEEGVKMAWRNAFVARRVDLKNPDYIKTAGFDNQSRLLEMVGAEQPGGEVVIFHAMEITNKMGKELGLI